MSPAAAVVTTRAPRINEEPGVHYHYWTVPDFLQAKDKDRFLEWAQVHGNYYGTLENEVTPFRAGMPAKTKAFSM